MMKCLNCKREIDHFNAESEATTYTQFRIEKGNLCEYGMSNENSYSYEFKCPECGAYITSNEEEAEAMLLGEKALRVFKAKNDKFQQKLGIRVKA